MRYLSVCSGIEAATVAWRPLGWQAVAFSEIEPLPDGMRWCDVNCRDAWEALARRAAQSRA